MNRCFPVSSLLFLLLVPWLNGTYHEDIGWDRLVEEFGDNLPLGRNVKVSLIESPAAGSYQPDTGNFELEGKSFSMKSGDSGKSSHATVVAQRFFGTHSAMAKAIDEIDVYEAVHWLRQGFLRTEEPDLPEAESSRVQNHSWVGMFDESPEVNREAVRRLDYAIERDGFVALVALRNDTAEVPPLLAHSYNAISIGRPNGSHSRGGTWFDEAGRTRPDIVSPGGYFTSFSVPVVSSAVAVLLEEADRTAGLLNARRNPQVIKSILMAGATKAGFSGWTRSDDRPLDPIFGAGQLDIYNSYRILTGGEHAPDSAALLPGSGWHLSATGSSERPTYYFSFDEKKETFAAHLTWHRIVAPDEPSAFADADVRLARMDLRLFEIEGTEPGQEIQISNDPVNNNQHLYVEDLPPGDYALRVGWIDDPSVGEAAYALAWDAAAPSPSSFGEWREQFFSGAELDDEETSGPDADPDNDGIPNLLEYALGGQPHRPDRTILPAIETAVEDGAEYLSLTFTRPVGPGDIEYRVDASSQLSDWSKGAGILTGSTPGPAGSVTEKYRHPEPVEARKRSFLRLTIHKTGT